MSRRRVKCLAISSRKMSVISDSPCILYGKCACEVDNICEISRNISQVRKHALLLQAIFICKQQTSEEVHFCISFTIKCGEIPSTSSYIVTRKFLFIMKRWMVFEKSSIFEHCDNWF